MVHNYVSEKHNVKKNEFWYLTVLFEKFEDRVQCDRNMDEKVISEKQQFLIMMRVQFSCLQLLGFEVEKHHRLSNFQRNFDANFVGEVRPRTQEMALPSILQRE